MKKNKNILEEIARIRLLMEGRAEALQWITSKIISLGDDEVGNLFRSADNETRRTIDNLANASEDDIIKLFSKMDPVRLGEMLFNKGILFSRSTIDNNINAILTNLNNAKTNEQKLTVYKNYLDSISGLDVSNFVPSGSLDESWFRDIMENAFSEWKVLFLKSIDNTIEERFPDLYKQIVAKFGKREYMFGAIKIPLKLWEWFDNVWFKTLNEDAGTLRRTLSSILTSREKLQEEFVLEMNRAIQAINQGKNPRSYVQLATDKLIAANKTGDNIESLKTVFMGSLDERAKREFRNNNWGESQIDDLLKEAVKNPKYWKDVWQSLSRYGDLIAPLFCRKRGTCVKEWGLWARRWFQMILKINPITAAELKKDIVNKGLLPTGAIYMANWAIGRYVIAPALYASAVTLKESVKAALDPNESLFDQGIKELTDLWWANYSEVASPEFSILELTGIDDLSKMLDDLNKLEAPNVAKDTELENILGDCASQVRKYYVTDSQVVLALIMSGRAPFTLYWGDIPTGWPNNEKHTIFKDNNGVYKWVGDDNKFYSLEEVAKGENCK